MYLASEHVLTLTVMRELKEFLDARRVKCRFRTVEDLCAAAGVSAATYHRIADAVEEEPRRSRARTQEAIAEALKFREWAELLDAWRADDVMLGLDAAPRGEAVRYDELARDWQGVLEEARKHGLSPQQVREAIQRTRPRNQGQGS
jgi:GNAT superfamily N-acetyltransferase